MTSKDDDNNRKYAADNAEEEAEEVPPKKQKMIGDDNCQSGLRHFPWNYYKSSLWRFVDGGIKALVCTSRMNTRIYVVRAVGA
jgi:hypothetical protein